MIASTDRLPILYIAGMGRSGSTLLSSLLAGIPGLYPVGEMRSLWTVIRDDERCGCGAVFSACPFWQEVGREAFGGWERLALDHMLACDARFARHRSIPMLMSRHRKGTDESLRDYLGVLEKTYEATRLIAGCDVIVDSSKDAPFALILSQSDHLSVIIVHLVRDPRGVAHSWSRIVKKPEYALNALLREKPMARYGIMTAAMQWVVINGLYEIGALGPLGNRLRMRYEDLVDRPARELRRLRALDARLAEAGAIEEAAVEVKPFHTLGGNPLRFRWGTQKIRRDDAWASAMPTRKQAAILATTLPLALRYGYLLSSPSGSKNGRRASATRHP